MHSLLQSVINPKTATQAKYDAFTAGRTVVSHGGKTAAPDYFDKCVGPQKDLRMCIASFGAEGCTKEYGNNSP